MLNINVIREALRTHFVMPESSISAKAKLINCPRTSFNRIIEKAERFKLDHLVAQQCSDTELQHVMYPAFFEKDSLNREPDYDEHYKQSLKKNGKSKTVQYLEYRAKDPSTALSKSQYFYKVRKFLKKCRLAMRQLHLAGEVVYVDYAGTKVCYEKDGKKVWIKVFVGVLGASKKIFAFATPGERTNDWINGMNKMFAAFGGVTLVISIDNATALVSKPGLIPTLTKNIALFGEHYGCIIDSCRVRKPQDKSLAELGVKFVTQRILRPMNQDMTFFSADEINAHIVSEVEVLNNLPLQKLKVSRNALFEEIDKPVLLPLPSLPFIVLDDFKVVKVPADYHIEYNNHYYSVPYTLAHEHVEIVVTNTHINIVYQHNLQIEHALCDEEGGSSTITAHLSPEHAFEATRTKDEYMKWAESVGVSAVAYVEQQYCEVNSHKSRAVGKRIQNLMNISQGKALRQIENACDYAIQNEIAPNEMGMVFKMLDYLATKTPALTNSTTHQNIRGKAAFGDHHAH